MMALHVVLHLNKFEILHEQNSTVPVLVRAFVCVGIADLPSFNADLDPSA